MLLRKVSCGFLLLIVWLSSCYVQGAILEGPSSVIAFPGETVELICNVTGGIPQWIVNGTTRSQNDLFEGLQPGHNISNNNIVIEDITLNDGRNGTEYICELPQTAGTPDIESDPAFIYVAGVPRMVPGVMVVDGSITFDGGMVVLTLSWGEPFNNFDPISNYTVSCSGNVTCPPDVTTTDNTTRNLTITNLTPRTNYTFSVVATNSIGSGEAGIVMFTAPSLPEQVVNVMLTCEPVDLINQCTVDWDPITVGNGLLEQPLVYQVYYNGTTMNVTSPTTTLTFDAPSLPDDVFVDNITVIVTAVNIFGAGPASDPVIEEIMSTSVADATATLVTPNENRLLHDITVTCTIDPDSEAEQCEVMAVADGRATRTGTAGITNGGMATVTVTGLDCGVTYTITAAGTLNGDLVGPRSSHGNIMSGPCPTTTSTSVVPPTTTIRPTVTPGSPGGSGGSDDSSIGPIIGGVVGGIVVAVIILLVIILLVWCYYNKKQPKSSRASSPFTNEKGSFRPTSVRVQTLDRYGKPQDAESTDMGVELTGYQKSPDYTQTTLNVNTGDQPKDDATGRATSSYMPEGSYDTLAPADEPNADQGVPAQNGQNQQKPRLNYAELEQFTRKPASVKKPEPQPQSQYAVIDPRSLTQGTYT